MIGSTVLEFGAKSPLSRLWEWAMGLLGLAGNGGLPGGLTVVDSSGTVYTRVEIGATTLTAPNTTVQSVTISLSGFTSAVVCTFSVQTTATSPGSALFFWIESLSSTQLVIGYTSGAAQSGSWLLNWAVWGK